MESTKKQRQLIKIAQKNLGLDDQIYREMLQAHFGVDSCTRLSRPQADRLIAMFKQRGFRVKKKISENPPRRRPRRAGNVVRLASAREQGKIAALRELIHWRIRDGFTAWLGARFSIERVRTAQDAWRVIEGLKNLFENQMQAEYGAHWLEHLPDDDGVRRYVAEHKLK